MVGQNKDRKAKKFVLIMTVLIVAAGSWLVYGYFTKTLPWQSGLSEQRQPEMPEVASQEEIERIQSTVGERGRLVSISTEDNILKLQQDSGQAIEYTITDSTKVYKGLQAEEVSIDSLVTGQEIAITYDKNTKQIIDIWL